MFFLFSFSLLCLLAVANSAVMPDLNMPYNMRMQVQYDVLNNFYPGMPKWRQLDSLLTEIISLKLRIGRVDLKKTLRSRVILRCSFPNADSVKRMQMFRSLARVLDLGEKTTRPMLMHLAVTKLMRLRQIAAKGEGMKMEQPESDGLADGDFQDSNLYQVVLIKQGQTGLPAGGPVSQPDSQPMDLAVSKQHVADASPSAVQDAPRIVDKASNGEALVKIPAEILTQSGNQSSEESSESHEHKKKRKRFRDIDQCDFVNNPDWAFMFMDQFAAASAAADEDDVWGDY